MNENQLEIFRVVAEKRNFTEAARLLHISQPAISMQVHALEEYYGVRLFDRTTKSVNLTGAGAILYRYAVEILGRLEDAKREISESAQIVRGKLLIGASLTVAGHVLPPILKTFHDRYPEVLITMEVMNTDKVMEKVLDLSFDMGLVEGQVTTSSELEVETLAHDELIVVLPVGHPWAGRASIDLADVAKLPLVMRETGSGTRKVMEERLQQAGLDPNILNVVMELGSTEAIKGAVHAGLGAAILSRWTVQQECRQGTMRELNIKGVQMQRNLSLVTNPHKSASQPAHVFADYCRERIPQHHASR